MPVVPVYNPGQVQPTATPNVRVGVETTAETFGGGASLDRVIQSSNFAAKEGQDLFLQEKAKADDLASTEAYTKTVKLKNDLFYDPKTGALGKRGKDAFGIVDEYGTKFEEATSEIENGLANEQQKQIYRKMRLREKAEFDGNLQRHMFQEAKSFDDQTTESGLSTTRDDAVMNYQNPGKVDSSVKLQESMIMAHAQRNGLPSEWVKLKTEEASSKTYSSVINRMLANGQDLQAKAYYADIKGKIVGSDATAVEKALTDGTVRGESQRQATNIFNQYRDDQTAALAAARKISDPDVQQATVQEIKTRFTESTEASRISGEFRYRQALQGMEQSKSLPDPGVMSAMTAQEQKAIRERHQQLRENVDVETNYSKYYELKTLAAYKETQGDFIKMNLGIYRPMLGDKEFTEIQKLQDGMRRKDAGADADNDGFRTKNSIVSDGLRANSIDPTPKPGTSDAEKVALFNRQVDDQIRQYQASTGKKISLEETQRIVDGLLIKNAATKSWFSWSQKRVFENTGKDKIEIKYDDIPAMEVNKMQRAFEKNRIPFSKEAATALYKKKLEGMVPHAD